MDIAKVKGLIELNKELSSQLQKSIDEIIELKPKADFYDAVIKSDDCKRMDEVAKLLCIPGYDSNQKLFTFLRSEGVLLSSDNHWNQPAQKYIDLKYFELSERPYERYGKTQIGLTTVVTQKGIEFIRGLINERITNPAD